MEADSPGALEMCNERHLKHAAPQQHDPARFDDETGLTWPVKKVMEEAKKLARENRVAEKLESKTYMLVDDQLEIMGLIAEKLNLLPQRAKSEMGLSDSQVVRLTRMLDEARAVAAKQIEANEKEEK